MTLREETNINMEEMKEETQSNVRPVTSLPLRSVQKHANQTNKYFFKDNYEQLDQVDEGSRPYSA